MLLLEIRHELRVLREHLLDGRAVGLFQRLLVGDGRRLLRLGRICRRFNFLLIRNRRCFFGFRFFDLRLELFHADDDGQLLRLRRLHLSLQLLLLRDDRRLRLVVLEQSRRHGRGYEVIDFALGIQGFHWLGRGRGRIHSSTRNFLLASAAALLFTVTLLRGLR